MFGCQNKRLKTGLKNKISSHQTFPGGRVTQNLVCWRELFEPSHGTSRQGSEPLGVASQKAKRNRRRAHLANQSRQASAPRDAVVNNSATRPTGEISLSVSQRTFNDPSAGSPTETLLRLLLPLNATVWSSFRQLGSVNREANNPRTSLKHSIGSSDGRCVQRTGT